MQNVNISGTQSSRFCQGNLITGIGTTIHLTNVTFSNNMIKTAVKSYWSAIYLTDVLINNNEAYGTPTALDIYNSNFREARTVSLNRVTVIAAERKKYNKETNRAVQLIVTTQPFRYNDVQVKLRKYQTSCIGTTITENVNFSTYVKALCPAQFSAAFTKSFAMHYFPKTKYQMNCVQCLNFTNVEDSKYSSSSVMSSTISTISQKTRKLNEGSLSIKISYNINLILFLFLSSVYFIC